jgi:hypothetical protein
LTVLDESASGEAVIIPRGPIDARWPEEAVVFAKRGGAASALNFEITRAGKLLYEQTVQPE